jgi:hypothetical protein
MDTDLGSSMSLIKITASNLYFALQYTSYYSSLSGDRQKFLLTGLLERINLPARLVLLGAEVLHVRATL